MSSNRVALLGVLLCVCEPALAQSTIPASSADWILDGDQAPGPSEPRSGQPATSTAMVMTMS